MHATDVVGYTFNADNYCPACIIIAMGGDPALGAPSDTEGILDIIAATGGIDRYDERSYDSGDHPKVIFADSVHDACSLDNGYEPGQCADRCGRCHEPLGHECHNVKEATT